MSSIGDAKLLLLLLNFDLEALFSLSRDHSQLLFLFYFALLSIQPLLLNLLDLLLGSGSTDGPRTNVSGGLLSVWHNLLIIVFIFFVDCDDVFRVRTGKTCIRATLRGVPGWSTSRQSFRHDRLISAFSVGAGAHGCLPAGHEG